MARTTGIAIDRREEILRSAVLVLTERGHAHTRLSHVADRCGVSQALVIYYFGTRDRLLAEALAYSDSRFYEHATAELAEIGSATDKLIRLLELSCAVGDVNDPEEPSWVLWLDVWAVAARNPEVAEHRRQLDRRWRETIAAIVHQGESSGEFKRVDIDDFTIRLAALVDGLAVQLALEDDAVSSARMLDLCLGAAASELGLRLPDGDARRLEPGPRPARPKRRSAAVA